MNTPRKPRILLLDDEPSRLWQSYVAAKAAGVEVVPVLQDIRGADFWAHRADYPDADYHTMEEAVERQEVEYGEPEQVEALAHFDGADVEVGRVATIDELCELRHQTGANAVLTDYNMPWFKGDALAYYLLDQRIPVAIHTMGGADQEMDHRGRFAAEGVKIYPKDPEKNMGDILDQLAQSGRGQGMGGR